MIIEDPKNDNNILLLSNPLDENNYKVIEITNVIENRDIDKKNLYKKYLKDDLTYKNCNLIYSNIKPQ